MPNRAAHPCGQPGCPKLVRGKARCEEHERAYDLKRGTAAERGYDAAWRKLRAAHLAAHPWCLAHAMTGQQVQATEVDHITAHRGNDALRLDPTNLASLCKPCHSRKTAREDGGFGNAPVLKGEGEGRSTF